MGIDCPDSFYKVLISCLCVYCGLCSVSQWQKFPKLPKFEPNFFLYINLCICVLPLVCMHHMHVSINKSQKRASDSLELELEVVVSQLMKVLETELGFSARAASAVNCWAISSSPWVPLFFKHPLLISRCSVNYTILKKVASDSFC